MTRGETQKIALVLHKIALVEERINKVEVWEHLGPDGIDAVNDLNIAMNVLAHIIEDDTAHSIKLKISSKEEA